MVIFNSNYLLYFIIIFYVYDSKINFIYAIPFIFRPPPHCYFQSSYHGKYIFLPAQCRSFTVTVVDCYSLSFYFVSSFPTSATTRWVRWLHWEYFSELYYYRYISSLFFSKYNGVVSPSTFMIITFWSVSVIHPH